MQINSIAPELQKLALFRGVYSHVARKLGVTPQHVRMVALGEHRSKRVSAAIKKEVERRRGKDTELAA